MACVDSDASTCPTGCTTNADCTDSRLHLCDTTRAMCVSCLSEADCASGLRCESNPQSSRAGDCVTCTATSVDACLNDESGHACLTATDTCGCVVDSACNEGSVCASTHACVTGCRGGGLCPSGTVCSSNDDSIGQCVAMDTDAGVPPPSSASTRIYVAGGCGSAPRVVGEASNSSDMSSAPLLMVGLLGLALIRGSRRGKRRNLFRALD